MNDKIVELHDTEVVVEEVIFVLFYSGASVLGCDVLLRVHERLCWDKLPCKVIWTFVLWAKLHPVFLIPFYFFSFFLFSDLSEVEHFYLVSYCHHDCIAVSVEMWLSQHAGGVCLGNQIRFHIVDGEFRLFETTPTFGWLEVVFQNDVGVLLLS